MASAIAFFFGTLSLLLPFLTMTLIYENRRYVKRVVWKEKFGMLTEEVRSKNILQLYYFPLFMYQRLMISGIVVFLYDYPLIQCVLVMLCNACMMAYLIIVRPFRDENQ